MPTNAPTCRGFAIFNWWHVATSYTTVKVLHNLPLFRPSPLVVFNRLLDVHRLARRRIAAISPSSVQAQPSSGQCTTFREAGHSPGMGRRAVASAWLHTTATRGWAQAGQGGGSLRGRPSFSSLASSMASARVSRCCSMAAQPVLASAASLPASSTRRPRKPQACPATEGAPRAIAQAFVSI